jgi:hypothetical protein
MQCGYTTVLQIASGARGYPFGLRHACEMLQIAASVWEIERIFFGWPRRLV